MAKVGITDTILRDAHQSQAATRMRFSQMEPAFEKLDKVGYFSLECWGGATFDSCLRFLNEDPWERLRTLRKGLPNTKLQMLLRDHKPIQYPLVFCNAFQWPYPNLLIAEPEHR